ncbi:MAG TPA: MBL fold metallo-hydrolase [Mycobacteriales bacterium]|jgi:L-ascorbate metabolism protein UlaG (beta-lactamase superfamily)|nr:MBL fold metallo-hydrolase [Mycobacteriales bacterium]
MRITWWGHATTLIEDAGIRLLTDPVLTHRVGHLKRRAGPRPDESASRVDVAVVSHLHADHLHLPSLRQLRTDALIVVPRGAGRLLRGVGRARVREVSVGETVRIGELLVEVVRADHDGHRGPWSRAVAPAVGYVVRGSCTTYFAGDTDYFAGMSDLGPLDVALLPVGGWGPTLGPGHLDPGRAAHALRLLHAATAVPIHYGTLWPVGMDRVRPGLFADPGHQFATAAAEQAPDTTVRVLRPGESLKVESAA